MSAVRSEVRGHVLELVLDRPKANAIDRATGLELYEAFARLRDDPELRVAILTAPASASSRPAGTSRRPPRATRTPRPSSGPGAAQG